MPRITGLQDWKDVPMYTFPRPSWWRRALSAPARWLRRWLRRWRLWRWRRDNAEWITVGIVMHTIEPPRAVTEDIVITGVRVRGEVALSCSDRVIVAIARDDDTELVLPIPFRVGRGQTLEAKGLGSVVIVGMSRIPSRQEKRRRAKGLA